MEFLSQFLFFSMDDFSVSWSLYAVFVRKDFSGFTDAFSNGSFFICCVFVFEYISFPNLFIAFYIVSV